MKKIKALLATLAILLPFAAAYGDPANYERSVSNTLIHEGYTYENVPGDPGGPTKYGITIHDVRRYINPHATARDVKQLTLADAKKIYHDHYWVAVGADNLARGLDYAVFDYAVNAGIGRAIPTLRACQKAHPVSVLDQINCVCDRRMAFQMGLPSRFNKFKRGWRNRINSVKVNARAMYAGVARGRDNTDLFVIPRVGPGKAEEGYLGD